MFFCTAVYLNCEILERFLLHVFLCFVPSGDIQDLYSDGMFWKLSREGEREICRISILEIMPL